MRQYLMQPRRSGAADLKGGRTNVMSEIGGGADVSRKVVQGS